MRRAFLPLPLLFLALVSTGSLLPGCSPAGSGGGDEAGGRPLPKDVSSYPHSPPLAFPRGAVPQSLNVIPRQILSVGEHAMIASLQGLVARSGRTDLIWIGEDEAVPWLGDIEATYGIATRWLSSASQVLSLYWNVPTGYVLYSSSSNPDSVNAAASLAGPLGAIIVERRDEGKARALGLPLVLDATDKDEAWALETYGDRMSSDFVIEVAEEREVYLKDLASLLGAFVFHAGEGRPRFAEEVLSLYPVGARIFGWRGDSSEIPSVEDYSLNAMIFTPGSIVQNLSTLSQVPAPVPPQPFRPGPIETQDGIHYISFLMSDGDNLTSVYLRLPSESLFGSPLRGRFPLSWELPPTLPVLAPTILAWFHRNASASDNFVSASSGSGYVYPSLYPDMEGYLAELDGLLARSDQRIVTVIDDAPIETLDPFCALQSVEGVVYKKGDYYSEGKGEIRFANGKPIVSVRLSLWEGAHTPRSAADLLNTLPRSPLSDQRSYSIVNVNVFSTYGQDPRFFSSMENVARTVELLDPALRVVTIEELAGHISRNFGGG